MNTVAELERTPCELGVEVDLRDYNGKLVLQHDPWKDGESFEDFLEAYAHRFLVANVKCEGVEKRVLDCLQRRGVGDFFLLDLSLPAVVKLASSGERRIAMRWSEHEPIESCAAFTGLVDWVWIDCFTHYPHLTAREDYLLSSFRRCLVAPELQGRPPLRADQALALARKYKVHAVCTKDASAWINA